MKKLLVAALAAWAGQAGAAPQKVDLVLRDATVVDVAGGRLLRGQAVVTRGDRIVAVVDQRRLGAYKAGRTLSLKGRYLIPGLWDNHVHFGGGTELIDENKQLLPLYLAHGITTVRDCAGDLSDTVLQWRDEIAARTLLGPTILASGAKLEGYKPLWKGTQEVGTPEEVGQALDRLKAAKADFVKITENTMRADIYLDALRQARARGLPSSAHLHAQVTLDQAAEAGLGTVEHMPYLLRAATPREAELTAQVVSGAITGRAAAEQSLATFDEATARAAFRRLAARGTAVVPTLSVIRITAYLDEDDHARDSYLQYIGPKLRQTYDWRVKRAALDGPEAIAYRHANYEKAAALLPLLAQEGVAIVAGTDAGFLNSFDYPGQALHDELALYVKNGLTPQQALASSLIAGPRFLGKLEQHGALAAGKVADIVVLRANPLADIAATRQIEAVVTQGRLLDRRRLDAMLAAVREWVAKQ
ncbi:amidohydrolase family protein [Paucibacter sediminis]|uniref:Amidohydrolase family protein n=1 Tax=Paucibacter sediminis TaxID=3019553 RepID=A0AA95NIK6_9BURK|nr:amidohydrolase family protein [Paucibacter sp. S2-9]WIT10241.1 amidohydrolase family protein [Paucibacter sp. S2-9]